MEWNAMKGTKNEGGRSQIHSESIQNTIDVGGVTVNAPQRHLFAIRKCNFIAMPPSNSSGPLTD